MPKSLFQSTPSVGRATSASKSGQFVITISIHALRGEGDGRRNPRPGGIRDFNPRPPWGGRRRTPEENIRTGLLYFNPRPPWGGRRDLDLQKLESAAISIHALRGEGDPCGSVKRDFGGISIHALRGEGDRANRLRRSKQGISIHALRGEGDDKAELINKINKHFNPRPPWGGRRGCSAWSPRRRPISIHALRGEGDLQP